MDDSSRKQHPRLAQLHVPSPCSEPWETMVGDGHVRACQRCREPVVDLSALTADQAEVVLGASAPVCVRYALGRDGRVISASSSSARGGLSLALAAASLLSSVALAEPAADAAVSTLPAPKDASLLAPEDASCAKEAPAPAAPARPADVSPLMCDRWGRVPRMVMGKALRRGDPSAVENDTLGPRARRAHEAAERNDSDGQAQLAAGEFALALKSFRRALALRKALAAREPSVLTWQRGLAISHAFVGSALLALGERDAARDSYLAALGVVRHFRDEQLTGTNWRRWQLGVCARLRALAELPSD